MRFLLAILLLLIAAPASAQQGQGMSQAVVVSSCGGGAAPSGALNQLTMDTTGRLCQSGIGSNACTQAAAYLARTTGGNEGGNAVNITALICGLVTDGVIDGTLSGVAGCGSHLDALYILAQQNAADSLLNLCGTNFSLTTNGIFASYVGYHGFNSAGLLTNFNPTTATSPKYTTNSANVGVWVYALSGTATVGADFGGSSTDNSALVANFNNSNNYYCRINDASTGPVPTLGTKGLFSGDRSSATQTAPYWDGVSQGTQTINAVTVTSETFKIGTGFNNGPTLNTISEANFGGSLGATLNLALYNRLRTYMTSIGVP